MAAFITRKKSLLVLICAFLMAAGITTLLHHLLKGPKLGPHYDFLMEHRRGFAPAPELLIVDSGDFLEPDTAAGLILSLIEMDALSLVIQTPILGFSPGRTGSDEEIRGWFEDEFSLMERNIRNLFEAIQAGSIAPGEARRYVDELVGLTDQGKERLTAALVRQDNAGILRLEQVIAAFGRVYRAGDLRLSPGGSPQPAAQSYSRARPDWDGRVRRAAPVELPDGPEHVVYSALKDRFTETLTANTRSGLFLVNSRGDQEVQIPLDSRGNLLLEAPAAEQRQGFGPFKIREESFRRIPLEAFTSCREAEETLQRRLREADKLGIYSVLAPERSPLLLYDYAQAQREEFLVASDPGNPAAARFSREWKARWLQTRTEYFNVLEEFLYGPAEERLKTGYEELLASEGLGEEGVKRIEALRNELSGVFDGLRRAHREFQVSRETLSRALASAFVILGPGEAPDPAGQADPAGRANQAEQEGQAEQGGQAADSPSGPGDFFRFPKEAGHSDAEISFILADNILRGRGVRPLGMTPVLFFSLLAIAAELLVLARLSPLLSLGLGCVFSLLTAAGFSWAFVVWGRWIDPLIPFGGSLAGTLGVFTLGLVIVRRGARRFRLAYGPHVGKPCLRQLIKTGQPAPGLRLSTQAAVIAVRQTGLLAREDQEQDGPRAAARAIDKFREEAAAIFKKAGAVIVGCDGDLLLACFGAPLERIGTGPGRDPYVRYSRTPALRAAEFVAELAGQDAAARWKFGVDAGECAFGYLPVAGYRAYGRPVVRARVLSGLALRSRPQALVSESVRAQIKDIPVRKLRAGKQDGEEIFYELVLR
jgi:class 3 adenylate cyclase